MTSSFFQPLRFSLNNVIQHLHGKRAELVLQTGIKIETFFTTETSWLPMQAVAEVEHLHWPSKPNQLAS